MNIVKVIKERVRHHLILQSVSDMFERIGITIIPYYLFQEFVSDKLDLDLEPKLNPVVAGFLSYSEIEKLCLLPESRDLELDMDKLLWDGCRCFALKYNEDIVSYMLCDFHSCDSRLTSFPLNKDEVYLSGAFTFSAHRGKNLAAVLEHELYKKLYDMSMTKYYSINVLFNTPGLKFKKKLKSRPLKLCLYIRLLGKYQWNITLKRYRR